MKPPKTDTLFLTLRLFSATGGIEKVCMAAGKALYELSGEQVNKRVKIFSLYDETEEVNPIYFPAQVFLGFGKQRLKFLLAAIKQGSNSRMVILSHVNLVTVGFAIKLFSPKTKLFLIAHGIEVWRNFPGWKKMMLAKCDQILPVSDFTKKKMMQLYNLPEEKFTILNNCLDPFLPPAQQQPKDENLLMRYGIDANDKVLFTLTRLAGNEGYKGYDKVINAIHFLKEKYPGIKYLLVGKYDAIE